MERGSQGMVNIEAKKFLNWIRKKLIYFQNVSKLKISKIETL